jgi:hypothetical protein
MNKTEALKLYDEKFYEDVIKTHSLHYHGLPSCIHTGGEIPSYKYPQSQYLNKFKKSFLNWKMGKPIVSKDGCLGEREFMALMSLCNAVKKDTTIQYNLQSHQQKHINTLKPRAQLKFLRELFGMKDLSTPIEGSKEPVKKADEPAEEPVNSNITYNVDKSNNQSTPMVDRQRVFNTPQYEIEKALYGEHAAKIRFMMRLNE